MNDAATHDFALPKTIYQQTCCWRSHMLYSYYTIRLGCVIVVRLGVETHVHAAPMFYFVKTALYISPEFDRHYAA